MPKDQRKYWGGSEPTHCQLCEKPLKEVFVDCATTVGWRMACDACHRKHGHGLGVGKGQRYQRLDSGKWLKIETSEKGGKKQPKPFGFLDKIETDNRSVEW